MSYSESIAMDSTVIMFSFCFVQIAECILVFDMHRKQWLDELSAFGYYF